MGLLNALFIPLCLMCCLVSVQSIRRPVIGVLMQRADQYNKTLDSKEYVIYSTYVKALEGSGAMVVPVLINEDVSYYKEIMSRTNGIVFPGGSADLMDPLDIGKAGGIIYRLAEELNDKGVHYPILGLCQGLQLLAMASAGMQPILSRCYGLTNIALPLKFIMDPSESYLFRGAPKEAITILQSLPVTANVHAWCVTRKSLEEHDLTSTWRVISVDRDVKGMQFITSMEHTRYPFVALQFHPEKIVYDIVEAYKFPTDYKAIFANRWFYDWLVEESKKNKNGYQGAATDHIIENYCPTLSFVKGFGMIEKYYFVHDSRLGSKSLA